MTIGGVEVVTTDERTAVEDAYLLLFERVPESVLSAALVGAVLGELRLLGPVAADERRWIRVDCPAPTGHPMLEPVLDRLASGPAGRRPQWVAVAGDEARAQVAARVRRADPGHPDPADAAALEAFRADLVADVLVGVAAW